MSMVLNILQDDKGCVILVKNVWGMVYEGVVCKIVEEVLILVNYKIKKQFDQLVIEIWQLEE